MKIIRFIQSDEASTAVEYAVMLMLVIGLAIAAIQSVGAATADRWAGNSDSINGALNN